MMKMQEGEAIIDKNQAIVSVLNFSVSPFRRTFSADMSSKNWFDERGGVYPMKKAPSSLELYDPSSIEDPYSSESSEDEENAKDDDGLKSGFHSIQETQTKNEDGEKPGQVDIWNSILSQKVKEDVFVPPYVHPLVKRSTSSLSEKSLEICTESLGSETGSDGFSFNQPPEEGDWGGDAKIEVMEANPVIDNYVTSKKLQARSFPPSKKLQERTFPPPIATLSAEYGASMQMRTQRRNGRLVVEAISVPSQSNFQALRQDGRLILTFSGADRASAEEKGVGKELKLLEEEPKRNENSRKIGFFLEAKPEASTWLLNFHGLTGITNKSVVIATGRNPTWRGEKELEEMKEMLETDTIKAEKMAPGQGTAISLMLPPASVNTVMTNGYWWSNSIVPVASVLNYLRSLEDPSTRKKTYKSDKSGVDGLVPWLKGCKEQKSLMFTEAYCIAT